MSELLIRKVSKEELLQGSIPMNQVLCRAHYSSEGAKTKSGVVYGFNTELTYASEDGKDTSSHVADCAEVSMIVVKCPEKLYFDPTDNKGMDWDVEYMDLVEDDIIWTNPIDALNSVTLECEGEHYKFVPYQDIYAYKREIWVDKWTGKKKTIRGTINGYVLCSQIFKESLSEFDVTSEDKIDPTKGIIKYFGSPNKRYRREDIIDFQDIQVGDTVLFDKKATPFLLERTTWGARFDDELLWCVQRRGIVMILKRG